MILYGLTRTLIDIESISGNERGLARYLFGYLRGLTDRFDGQLEEMAVDGDRFNVFACWGCPLVVFSTHMDTVPPFFASSEDDEFIWGRGACDTKGIIASMLIALEQLLVQGIRDIGILLVIEEERHSEGARTANRQPRGARFLINGEPTENTLATGSKGSLRLLVQSQGRAAHSAYPELGDSAIHRLVAALNRLLSVSWPVDEVLGETTCNIGMLHGGRAANVIADAATAEVALRLVGDSGVVKELAAAALGSEVQWKVDYEVPAVRLETVPGFATSLVKYTTDIPNLAGWGKPLMLGPGSIHQAHTDEERISKAQLTEAVPLYQRLAVALLERARREVE